MLKTIIVLPDGTELYSGVGETNNIRSVTVARMTVPCCGGLPFAVKTAVEASGKKIPVYVATINPSGEIV